MKLRSKIWNMGQCLTSIYNFFLPLYWNQAGQSGIALESKQNRENKTTGTNFAICMVKYKSKSWIFVPKSFAMFARFPALTGGAWMFSRAYIWFCPKFALNLIHCGFFASVAIGKLGIKKKWFDNINASLPSQALSCVSFLFLASLSVLAVVLVPLFPRPLQFSPPVICEFHDPCEKWNHRGYINSIFLQYGKMPFQKNAKIRKFKWFVCYKEFLLLLTKWK